MPSGFLAARGAALAILTTLEFRVFGRRFLPTKRQIAVFCVALCVGLSVQMTIALLDRFEHALGVDHAPNALAGDVVQLVHQDHQHSHEAPPSHHHSDDPATTGSDHDGIAHEHQTQGMLLPWIVSAPIELFADDPLSVAYRFSAAAHPDAPTWQRERPPKLNLERIV